MALFMHMELAKTIISELTVLGVNTNYDMEMDRDKMISSRRDVCRLSDMNFHFGQD